MVGAAETAAPPEEKTIYLKTKNYEENDFDGNVGDCVGCQLGADDVVADRYGAA